MASCVPDDDDAATNFGDLIYSGLKPKAGGDVADADGATRGLFFKARSDGFFPRERDDGVGDAEFKQSLGHGGRDVFMQLLEDVALKKRWFAGQQFIERCAKRIHIISN